MRTGRVSRIHGFSMIAVMRGILRQFLLCLDLTISAVPLRALGIHISRIRLAARNRFGPEFDTHNRASEHVLRPKLRVVRTYTRHSMLPLFFCIVQHG